MDALISPALVEALEKQKYHFVGKHSAVKGCKWLHETLVHGRSCYKQKFYGIKTHQCIQMTPAVSYCTQKCLFCWRAQSGELEGIWNETEMPTEDSPEEIVDGSIKAQLRILSGYKGNERTDQHKLREAFTPRHAAISLAGEPTLYTNIGELIKAFHKKGFTTFLVSNGTLPNVLSKLTEEPTQLYISLCAANQSTYESICRPQVSGAWEKLNETLQLIPSLGCPTVIRITSVWGVNMKNVEGYARMITKAQPTYIEVKAYMHLGFSRRRLNYENMPSHRQIQKFALQLSRQTGYKIADESEDSRVVLLSKFNGKIQLS